jgi:hypothetical protein
MTRERLLATCLLLAAVEEKLQRVRRVRLSQECAKLDRTTEQTEAEELFSGEAEWPEY